MDIVKTIFVILEAIVSVALILVIMFQSGKEDGLSALTGGGNDTFLSKAGGLDKKLASITKWIALVWFLLALAISMIP